MSAAVSRVTKAVLLQPVDNGNVTGKHLARNFPTAASSPARAERQPRDAARMGLAPG